MLSKIFCVYAVLAGAIWYFVYYRTFKDVEPVPKIIHQLAPKDSSTWPEVWHTCQASWKKQYPDYQYMMWTDEKMDEFMRNEFPSYYQMYKNYHRNIYRVDAVRYFILYKYGGIYADMDVEVLKDFMSSVNPNKIHILESPYKHNENCQNALMISPKGHPFWLHVFRELKRSQYRTCILDVAGPRMIDRCMQSWWLAGFYLCTLPHVFFNPNKNTLATVSRDVLYTIHYGTCSYDTCAKQATKPEIQTETKQDT
jgi:hypothetical protein